MELLIVIINREEHFEKLISILVEAGVKGATISDSEGIGHFLAYEVPIFAGLKNLISEGKSANKTIIALLDEPETFGRLKKLLAEENELIINNKKRTISSM